MPFRLEESVDERKNQLEESERAQRYYFDASEAEQWMGEKELYMMSEEKAKVRYEVLSKAYYLLIDDHGFEPLF